MKFSKNSCTRSGKIHPHRHWASIYEIVMSRLELFVSKAFPAYPKDSVGAGKENIPQAPYTMHRCEAKGKCRSNSHLGNSARPPLRDIFSAEKGKEGGCINRSASYGSNIAVNCEREYLLTSGQTFERHNYNHNENLCLN